MQLPAAREEIVAACVETARRNKTGSGVAKLFAYFPGIELTVYPRDGEVQLAVFCVDYAALGVEPESFSIPVDVGISTYRKMHPATMPLHAKICGSYVNGYLSMAEALRKGYNDFINCDLNGYVAESAAASVFFIDNGVLKTARAENVLLGITRRIVLELAESLGIPVDESGIRAEDAASMDEAFFTSSTKRIQPIRSIDGQKLGRACPGPFTQRIRDALDRTYAGENPQSEKWLTYI
jgi:branched-chain amino acid aminotransferase